MTQPRCAIVPLIYDAAHAVGAKYRDGSGQWKPVGAEGKASCYSFQGNKNMTCLGEGGAVTTGHEEFAEIVRQLKTFGYVYGKQLRVASIGFNYRMTKAQYAAGISQLKKIDDVIRLRQEKMVRINTILEGMDEVIRPVGHGPGHGSHLYVIRIDTDHVSFSRDAFRAHLEDEYGVGTVQHYPAVWAWEALANLGYSEETADCPFAAKACRQVLSLPIFPRTSSDELEYTAWAVKETVSNLEWSN